MQKPTLTSVFALVTTYSHNVVSFRSVLCCFVCCKRLEKKEKYVFSLVASVALGMVMFSLTFHLAPSSDQHVDVSNTLVYDQTPAELQKFPSASAGLCVYW